MSYKMLDQRLKYEKALNIKKTRPNWARKVRVNHVQVLHFHVHHVFDHNHVHSWERLRGRGGKKDGSEEEEGMGEVA